MEYALESSEGMLLNGRPILGMMANFNLSVGSRC
jgi:hypothetical protein